MLICSWPPTEHQHQIDAEVEWKIYRLAIKANARTQEVDAEFMGSCCWLATFEPSCIVVGLRVVFCAPWCISVPPVLFISSFIGVARGLRFVRLSGWYTFVFGSVNVRSETKKKNTQHTF